MHPNETTLETEPFLRVSDIEARLRVEAEWLRRVAVATWAASDGGPGSRNYSRKRLGQHAMRMRGMISLTQNLLRNHTEYELPVNVLEEILDRIDQAENVVLGKPPTPTKKEGV